MKVNILKSVLLLVLTTQTMFTMAQEYDVIVIGAGIAGLATADHLLKKNQNLKVLILEGSGRIGGRIWTDRSFKNPIDLGAAWIHGINKNPIYEMAKQSNTELKPTNYNSLKIFDTRGKAFTDNDYQIMSSLIKDFEIFLMQQKSLSNDQSIKNTVNNFAQQNAEQLNQYRYLLDGYVAGHFEQEFAADAADLSLKYCSSNNHFEGGDVLVTGGYDSIINHLANKLKNIIQLKQAVTAIAYNKEDGVSITVKDKTFKANYVVCTVPLGVLKEKIITFNPALSTQKQNAIKDLGMGTYNKVVLQFQDPFWKKDESTDWIGKAGGTRKWTGFLNYNHYNNEPILVNSFTGSFALQQESKTDKQIVDETMAELRSMYPDAPAPIKTLVTRWGQNKFSYGSYSYVPFGFTRKAYDDMEEPVDNCLFFAGEATNSNCSSTVHGAYLSGIREADRIIKIMRTAPPVRKSNPITLQLQDLRQKLLVVQKDITSLQDKLADIKGLIENKDEPVRKKSRK